MSGKLDRRDEVRFIAYLEANHYIPDNKKVVEVAITSTYQY